MKAGGPIGIAGAGLMREIEAAVPDHLHEWWTQDLWCLHSPAWWRRHWERTSIVGIEVADTMPDGWQRWLDWQNDGGRYLGYVRVVDRRNGDTRLLDHTLSVPTENVRNPLLRSGG